MGRKTFESIRPRCLAVLVEVDPRQRVQNNKNSKWGFSTHCDVIKTSLGSQDQTKCLERCDVGLY